MWGMEVAADMVGQLLDAPKEGAHSQFHLIAAEDGLVGQGAFEVSVDQFVGVEVRGVARQVVQLDLFGVRPSRFSSLSRGGPGDRRGRDGSWCRSRR